MPLLARCPMQKAQLQPPKIYPQNPRKRLRPPKGHQRETEEAKPVKRAKKQESINEKAGCRGPSTCQTEPRHCSKVPSTIPPPTTQGSPLLLTVLPVFTVYLQYVQASTEEEYRILFIFNGGHDSAVTSVYPVVPLVIIIKVPNSLYASLIWASKDALCRGVGSRIRRRRGGWKVIGFLDDAGYEATDTSASWRDAASIRHPLRISQP
ncbi:hypothetical protein M422DRAFT_779328 [Sphaerobolus stellatus SS14]|uniref:Uncharacterized protein n=1 Tax=Sphaerobolus stellatus (strain SS14) TaxID=990650 RepID=A0A0C9W007_SPHS4|nr:hypothetical protein M422DRAFT_779328 [Sphaerobolus stellatus SS14]